MAAAEMLVPNENRGPEILAICGSLVALALIAVALRLWVRTRMVGWVGIDDWVIVAAMVVMFIQFMILVPEVHLGGGRHVQYIMPPENVNKALHLNFVNQPLCLIALCLTKVSVGFFLLRLTPSPMFKRFVIGMMLFTVFSATGNFLTVLLQCRPISAVWEPRLHAKCIPPSHLQFVAFFNSSVAALSDVVFAFLPIPMLWKVQMNGRVKSAVAGILSLGLFAAVAAIVKIVYLRTYTRSSDFLWKTIDLTIWTTVEINVAIIAASLPSIKPLFKSMFDGNSEVTAIGYGGKYKNYTRNGGSRITKLGGSTATNSGNEPQFEMFPGVGKYGTDVKIGVPSLTGSEESILSPPPPVMMMVHEGNLKAAGLLVPKIENITKTTTMVVSYDDPEERLSRGWVVSAGVGAKEKRVEV